MAQKIYVIFDGPPGSESGRFIEVEDELSVSLVSSQNGFEWSEDDREGKTYWRLGPFYAEEQDESEIEESLRISGHMLDKTLEGQKAFMDALKEAEAKIERLIKAGDELWENVRMEWGHDNEDALAWEEAKR